MPAEKRPPELQNDDASSPLHPKLRRQEGQPSTDDEDPSEQQPSHQSRPRQLTPKQEVDATTAAAAEDEDSDVSDTGDPQHQEFAYVDLQSIRKEVQCPICLGIIKKTRTVMECLHRFCRECIDKSMRMGNNECPACRTHCASRRSLRDDPRYDAIIAALYPDIRKFEEEELAFCEEDETRNKQIQESIAQLLVKQSEALGKKRPVNKDTVGTSVTRPQRSCRNGQSRRRRRRRNASPEYQDSDDNNDAHGIDKLSDPDEHHPEIKQRKGRSRATIGSSHCPSSTSVGSSENTLDQRMEAKGSSPWLTCSAEMLAWGRGGVRSNTRNSSISGGTSRSARRIRLTKLVDFLRNLEENDDEYVALQTSLSAENVQRLGLRDCHGSSDHQSMLLPSSATNDKPLEVTDPLQNRLHMLEREVISGAVANCISNGEQLILAYQQKEAT